jgi:hypothetical protein
MRVLNDFVCPKGHRKEYFVENHRKTTGCDTCGAEATKVQTSIRFRLEGVSGDYPTALDKWVKNRKEKLKQEQKYEASTGETLTHQRH